MIKEHSPYPDIPFLIVVEGTTVNENRRPLNELLKMTTIGKLFFTGLAGWILGRSSKLKIKGNPQEIEAIANALKASKVFQDELRMNGGNIDAVMDKLRIKHLRGREFERVLGVPFPL